MSEENTQPALEFTIDQAKGLMVALKRVPTRSLHEAESLVHLATKVHDFLKEHSKESDG